MAQWCCDHASHRASNLKLGRACDLAFSHLIVSQVSFSIPPPPLSCINGYQLNSVRGNHAIHWHPAHSGEESEITQPVTLTYLNRWKEFYPGKIIITIRILTIMKKKRHIIVKYQWYFDLGGINFNSHFKKGCCLSTVNENR